MPQEPTSMGEYRVAKLKYILLSGNYVGAEFAQYHDSAYRLWKKNWQETFQELKSEAKVRADDFVRQNIISALFDGEEAVGLLLHTYLNLNLEAVRDHTYLNTYPPQVLDDLRRSGASEVLSMEYLTLDSKWRKSQVGIPLAEIILGLGAKVFNASGLNSMIIVTRNEKRVNEILYGFGGRCLVPNLTKHNVAVDLVSLDPGKTHTGKDPLVAKWIEFFWSKRIGATKVENLRQYNYETKINESFA